jgi:hypothetical protein
MVDRSEAYLAVIEWQLARQAEADGVPTDSSATTTEAPELPVVYVVVSDGSKIGANVQASVANATVDVATVRFADSREEALEVDDQQQPVRDDGVLLSISPLPPDPARVISVELEVYRSIGDHKTWDLSIGASGDGARVTTSSLQPL